MSFIKKQGWITRHKAILLFFSVCADMCYGQSTWELVTSPPINNNLKSVTFGNGRFVTAGDSGTISTSPDGAA